MQHRDRRIVYSSTTGLHQVFVAGKDLRKDGLKKGKTVKWRQDRY